MQLNVKKEAHFTTGDPDLELDPTVSFCVDILYSFNNEKITLPANALAALKPFPRNFTDLEHLFL
jgi:hypothetical protein